MMDIVLIGVLVAVVVTFFIESIADHRDMQDHDANAINWIMLLAGLLVLGAVLYRRQVSIVTVAAAAVGVILLMRGWTRLKDDDDDLLKTAEHVKFGAALLGVLAVGVLVVKNFMPEVYAQVMGGLQRSTGAETGNSYDFLDL